MYHNTLLCALLDLFQWIDSRNYYDDSHSILRNFLVPCMLLSFLACLSCIHGALLGFISKAWARPPPDFESRLKFCVCRHVSRSRFVSVCLSVRLSVCMSVRLSLCTTIFKRIAGLCFFLNVWCYTSMDSFQRDLQTNGKLYFIFQILFRINVRKPKIYSNE